MPDIHHEPTDLEREINPMPDDVRVTLAEAGLDEAFHQRPAYQQNDYLGWIGQAHRLPTREKRISQMITELRTGGVYMGMDHPPSRQG